MKQNKYLVVLEDDSYWVGCSTNEQDAVIRAKNTLNQYYAKVKAVYLTDCYVLPYIKSDGNVMYLHYWWT